MTTATAIKTLRDKAADMPAGGPADIERARRRAIQSADRVAAAVLVDPTLPERDRCQRDFDLLAEALRQLKPLARQALVEKERRRLVAAFADPREIARLGRTNRDAPRELEDLSLRAVEIASNIEDAALPDWNTPRRILERSERLLPSADHLEEIADQLRSAIKESLDLPYPASEALELAQLADQITAAAKRINDREE